jgi:hypothetical protein
MTWIEISQIALNLMHERRKVTYFTQPEVLSRPNIVDDVRRDGYQVVVITEQQKSKLESQMQTGGPQVRTVEKYVQEFNSSFEFKFVDVQGLTSEERRIYDFTSKILALVGIDALALDIRISETMRITSDDTGGVWDPELHAIVIKRTKLSSLVDYAAVLLHEAAHATSGKVDATREFENVLTDYLGRTSVAALTDRSELPSKRPLGVSGDHRITIQEATDRLTPASRRVWPFGGWTFFKKSGSRKSS